MFSHNYLAFSHSNILYHSCLFRLIISLSVLLEPIKQIRFFSAKFNQNQSKDRLIRDLIIQKNRELIDNKIYKLMMHSVLKARLNYINMQ